MKAVVRIFLLVAVLAVLRSPAFAQFGGPPPGGQLNWSGDVDDTVLIYIHGDNIDTRTVHGKDTANISVDLHGRLPHRPEQVFLENWSGRGHVKVVQQPDPYNDFTAIVRVRDPQPGRGHYTLSVGWQPIDFGGPGSH